jgi:hypothetical protein
MVDRDTPPISGLEDRLDKLLAFVDGHVKFAETKNAALLAAGAGIAIAVVQLQLGDHAADGWLAVYLVGVLCSAIASVAIALVSFLPLMQIPWLKRRSKKASTGNLMFFGDAQTYDQAAYIAALATAIGVPELRPTEFELMYAEQIIINSKIASRKFTYFKIGLWILLIGLLTLFGAGALFWMVADRDT